MRTYSKIVISFLIVLLLVPVVLFSQHYNRRQLSGLYRGSSGGIPMRWYGNLEVIGTPPTNHYKLYIRPWGRFVFKHKEDGVRYVHRFLFIKSRPKKWGKFHGKWTSKGDSLYLNYGSRHKLKKAYHVQFNDDYKVLGIWKIYRFRLTGMEFSFMKVWKGDE